MGLATASHHGWSANLYTMASDVFSKHAVVSVVGIAGSAYLLALAILPLLVPNVKMDRP